MKYVKIPLNFCDTGKMEKLRECLDSDAPAATTIGLRLCLYVATKAPNDGIMAAPLEEIEGQLHWKGRRGRCILALVQSGYLEKAGKGYRMKDWEAEQGHLRFFQDRARKAAKVLWKGSTVDASSIASSIATSNA